MRNWNQINAQKMLQNGGKQFATVFGNVNLQASILKYEPIYNKRKVVGIAVIWCCDQMTDGIIQEFVTN